MSTDAVNPGPPKKPQVNPVRGALRAMKRRLITYRPCGAPAVAVFGTPRSGSTFLTDMLAANRGVWFANEPYAVYPGRWTYPVLRQQLPEKPAGQLIALNDEELAQVERHTRALLRAEVRVGTCRCARFPIIADRVALKVLNAASLIRWFDERFTSEMRIINLFRHPAPQALSLLRNGWLHFAPLYFNHPTFFAEHLTPEQIEHGRRLCVDGNAWDHAVLGWVAVNLVKLRYTSPRVLRVSHEEATTRIDELIQLLGEQYGFVDTQRMREAAARPSGSSQMSSNQNRSLLLSGDRERLVRAWQDRIDDDQRRRAQAILDQFGVTMYTMDRAMPADDELLFA